MDAGHSPTVLRRYGPGDVPSLLDTAPACTPATTEPDARPHPRFV